eukprot:s3607_g5.t1
MVDKITSLPPGTLDLGYDIPAEKICLFCTDRIEWGQGCVFPMCGEDESGSTKLDKHLPETPFKQCKVSFRADLGTLFSSSLSQTKANGEHILAVDDVVELHGLKSDSLNGRNGVVVKLPDPDAPAEEARVGVMLQRDDVKAVRPQHLRFRGSRAPPPAPYEVLRWLPRLGEDFTFGAQEEKRPSMEQLDEELKEHGQKLRAASGTEALESNADLTASPSRIFGPGSPALHEVCIL